MAKFSADEVYKLLSPHSLTQEQRAVVEGAATDAPTLVIAGAGSGKTELMTVRVLYLIANSLAQPGEILGLTFTRKAASELSARVNQALYKLRESQMWPESLAMDFTPPNITTYNSFGNDIFRKLSLAVGYESDATLLTEASSVALADELVRHLKGELHQSLEDWDKTKDYLIDLVLSLAAEVTDNQSSSDLMIQELERFMNHIASLPKSEKGEPGQFQYIVDLLDAANLNVVIANLVSEYLALKKRRNLVDFSDQVALALTALPEKFDHGYRFVLLDEYQDTSSIQTQLLSRLFRGQAVLAVGDPNQAIYGWRGASSNNLSGFHLDFGSKEPATFQLSKSWRSGQSVIDAANQLTLALNAAQPDLAPITLSPGVLDKVDTVTAEVFQDEFSEAEAIADWFEKRLDSDTSAALLLRTKASMPLFAQAIAARGIPVEVSGLSGLLQLPEVVDLICALKVIQRPESGAALMRLLAGPRWRIGPKDLAQLSEMAKRLSRIRSEVTSAMPVTIVEALDELARPGALEREDFSELGGARLVMAAKLLRKMRATSNIGLAQFAWVVVRELDLDIELFAHSAQLNPLANLEAFIARIAEYEQSSLRPSLTGLLSWLDYATERENFELPKSGAKKGTVQIMSVHSAKGLEWDLVALGQLNKGAFPVEGKGAKGWLAAGKLPFALRGDSNVLPVLDYSRAQTQKEANALYLEFQERNRARQLTEERRLAYVAVTRARSALHITASHYKTGNKKPRELSEFLLELLNEGLVQLVNDIPDVLESNPLDQRSEQVIWPFDPLGSKRSQFEQAAQAVDSAKPSSIDDFTELALLLEERERGSWLAVPELPIRLSASKLMQLITDPANFAEYLARPVPSLYSASAQRGTDFHRLLEEHWLQDQELADQDWAEEDLDLKAIFENSRFAYLSPEFVEQSIEFELGGLIVVCKIDAVFEANGGYQVVDWKSGSSPKAKADLEARAIQLALYRLAFAKWRGVGVEKVQASFFFAADGKEVVPERLLAESELIAAIEAARTARRD
jgi:DNA helicase-2/ATP-dependent DNA helicase PcrA